MKRLGTICLAVLGLVLAPISAAQGEEEERRPYTLAKATWAQAIVAGPDGAVWFLAAGGGTRNLILGKVTTSGAVTEFPLSVRAPRMREHSPARTIITGPDGNLWFGYRNGIGRSTTAGRVTSYPLPAGGRSPTALAVGPDRNIWFTEGAASRIGRITPGGQLSEFRLPPGRKPSGIVAGPDGNLWFTQRAVNKIGRITPAGRITEFRVPGSPAKLDSIAAGPDGNLWFAEAAAPRVGRITPRGKVTQFAVPIDGGTEGIVAGPGGRLYFASGAEIGAISPEGVISWPSCLSLGCAIELETIAPGPDGQLWVASGVVHCLDLCGGGTAIWLGMSPGTVTPYTLPPARLGIGPRLTRLRDGRTSVALVCGVRTGCRGTLRLGWYLVREGELRFRTMGRAPFQLSQGESKRISVSFSEENADYLGQFRRTELIAIARGEDGLRARRSLLLAGERSG